MQTISKRPSEDDLSSFAIINSDNLVSFGGKPNAIVRPLRRHAAAASHSIDANGTNGAGEIDIKQLEEELLSRINLNEETNAKVETDQQAENKNREEGGKQRYTKNSSFFHKQYDFNRELDSKLRRLQNNSKKSSKNVIHTPKHLVSHTHACILIVSPLKLNDFSQSHTQGSTNDVTVKRPLFVTTVPKGIFLQPVKELPLIPRRIYAYASRPRILVNPNVKTDNQDDMENDKNRNNTTKVSTRSQFSDEKKLHLPRVERQITPKFAAGLGAIAGGVAGIKLGGSVR